MIPKKKTVLFLGGGTGGHIYPNLAIAERLSEMGAGLDCHFLVSNREGDTRIMDSEAVAYTASPAQPLSLHPKLAMGVLQGILAGKKQASELIDQLNVSVVVATGGFVSGPAVLAAAKSKVPVGLVNLDAVPGKANSRIAKYATQVFTAYESRKLPGAERVGLPLRRRSVGRGNREAARNEMGLDPRRPMLLVTGGSTGAQSINEAMGLLVARKNMSSVLAGWQVLHITGRRDEQAVRQMYAQAASDMLVHVMGYCDRMGDAWSAADLAISRAGASSVAEAWANGTPCIFLPYPYHKDQHQKLNAQPMVDVGGGLIIDDLIEPPANAESLAKVIEQLTGDETRLPAMKASLASHRQADGAEIVARWVYEVSREEKW